MTSRESQDGCHFARLMKKNLKILVLLAISLVLIGSAWIFFHLRASKQTATFRTATVKRGQLLAGISATGTVEPEEVVDVGAQVAGQINSFGKDKNGKTVDYGSTVTAGTILAEIDPSLYQADVAQSTAQLAQAQAGVERAQADLGQLQAKLEQARRDWERAQKLGPSEALAQSSYDAYKSAYETAVANVKVGESSIVQAQKNADFAQAVLDRSRRNLKYCTITSPVDGVIVDRRVNIGQTVVSSLNAPSLFLIAKDLKRMQVWVAVNEADIGSIHPGQPVTFTVDACPGEVFKGEVGKVRLNATMTQNVVLYTVEVLTDNSSGRLLPYLTANVLFEVARRTDVLMVSNAALRWNPTTPDQIVPVSFGNGLRPASPGKGDAPRTPGTLWRVDGKFVRHVPVRMGITDGTNTEIVGEGLAEDMLVVVGEKPSENASAASNPFTPKIGQAIRSRANVPPPGQGTGH